ncbi:MAG: hypothetical protein A2Z83_01435 [Omnitrophica bacterium GWA2_52_8]|nr:MAG: hypothetical protein A2Z83_01435 [Omnitrophica bacterium GWA2_52_8]
MTDVCLILEGTYPYVAGGVSSWVYQLVKELKDVSFSIVFLGAHRNHSKKMHYEIPPNVVDFREFYLFDYLIAKDKTAPDKAAAFKTVRKFLEGLRAGNVDAFPELVRDVGDQGSRALNLHDLTHGYGAWKIIEDLYQGEKEEVSFVDYFWTWRFLYLPFFSILRLDLPRARVYHTVSTGYAGVVGAMAKIQRERPLILTEHGIYTRERKMEIAKADWIYSRAREESKVTEGQNFFKQWWMYLFRACSLLTYRHADEIITLFGQNRITQIEEGADPEKIRIIPNGVPVRALESRPKRENDGRFRVGFAGRVVPIKDVKTFIRSCRTICQEVPEAEIEILGPLDEDPDYVEECRLLAEMQGMGARIHFRGRVDMNEYYPKLDLIVLTSISEAQPLVILEALALGIPAVATDVGACREMLYGGSPDDRLIGPAGIITPIFNPEATARGVVDLARNGEKRKRYGQAGMRRVRKYYDMDDFLASYQELYAYYREEYRWPVSVSA